MKSVGGTGPPGPPCSYSTDAEIELLNAPHHQLNSPTPPMTGETVQYTL